MLCVERIGGETAGGCAGAEYFRASGFAKKDDLAWFLRKLCKMDYIHLPRLSPTGEMPDAYRKEHKSWDIYEREFLDLMDERRTAQKDIKRAINNSVLLCSEHEPEHRHRLLVVEYLQGHWGAVEIKHLSGIRFASNRNSLSPISKASNLDTKRPPQTPETEKQIFGQKNLLLLNTGFATKDLPRIRTDFHER